MTSRPLDRETTVETELGPEFTRELHSLAALVMLADKMARRQDGFVNVPAGWWDEHVRGSIDRLNEMARQRMCGGNA